MEIKGVLINPKLICWVSSIKPREYRDQSKTWVFKICFTTGDLEFEFDTKDYAEIDWKLIKSALTRD